MTFYQLQLKIIMQNQQFPNLEQLSHQSRVKNTQRFQQMKKFNQIFKKIKHKMRLEQFISNISKNNIYAKPIRYQPDYAVSHFLDWKGWATHNMLQNIILMLDIFFTFVNFVLSTFEAFLDQYQKFKKNHQYIIALNIIAVIIYFVKTIMSLGTQDVEHGIQYIYLTDIIKKQLMKPRFYVQVSLAVIIIINICLEQTGSQIYGIIYFVLCILKLYNLNFSLFKLQIMLVKTPKRSRYWKFFKVFMLNIITAHFTASIFLAMLKMDAQRNWYQNKYGILQNPGWFQLYLWALYWACTTMMTVGYGDFSPAIVQQAVIVAVLEILSSMVVAYNISQIGSIVLSMNQSNQIINSKIGLLRRMNSENTVSMGLNLVMEEYIIHQSKILQEFQYAKHAQLIRSMPMQLQVQYYSETQKNIFRKTPFFMNLSNQTLIQFFLQSQGKVYYPGQYIIQKAFVEQIHIVLKGQLGYCYRKPESSLNETIIQRINVNYSKERPLLLARSIFNKNDEIYFDIRATKYSYAMIINRQTFLSVLKQNQIDYHYYLMTLDIHQTTTTYAYKKCEYCRYGQHTKFQCPRLHFVPLRSNIISRAYLQPRYSNEQLRKSIKQYKRCKLRREDHIYAIKHVLNNQDIDQSKKMYIRKEKIQYSTSIFKNFGDKKANQTVSKHTLQIIFQGSKGSIGLNQDERQVKIELEEIDQVCDFAHYFTACNPSKLLHIPLRKSFNQLNRPLPSDKFVNILTQVIVQNLHNL